MYPSTHLPTNPCVYQSIRLSIYVSLSPGHRGLSFFWLPLGNVRSHCMAVSLRTVPFCPLLLRVPGVNMQLALKGMDKLQKEDATRCKQRLLPKEGISISS